MTSRQLAARLAEAVAILADCECFLEDPYAESRGWDAVDLMHRVGDFMDLYRDEHREGDAS